MSGLKNRNRNLTNYEKWYYFFASYLAIPAAIATAWLFSWVTGQFDVSYPAYINWLVGYISYEADLIKCSTWRYIRENS